MEDWDRFFEILAKEDPHGRLRGIHNGRIWYDHTKDWVTHASLQTSDMNGGVLEDLRGLRSFTIIGWVKPDSLQIGNFNETMRSYGFDRQFRGQIHNLEIYGSRASGRGALSLEEIGKR